MKAVVCKKYGTPDVLRIQEVPIPVPKDNELLIKIFATTVNRTDGDLLKARPAFARLFTGLLKPKTPILGTEFAGRVEAVGKRVTSFRVGDRVYGLNEGKHGAHGQYMTIAEDKAVATIPRRLTFEQAAASCEGPWYAYNFINKVKVGPGMKVLVNGATGGIGTACVQLSKYFGAEVSAVCRGKHFGLVRSLGAGKLFDYTKEDFTKSGETYDYVFDTVGKSTFGKCKPLLKSGGAYISSELGPGSQNIFLALFTPLFGKKKVKFPYPADCRGSILFVKELIEKRKYKPVIDRKYPLEKIVEAFRYVEKGQKIGNVVITVGH